MTADNRHSVDLRPRRVRPRGFDHGVETFARARAIAARGDCGDVLMRRDWDEGFACTLPIGHESPHRDEEMTAVEDVYGRMVRDIYEWDVLP